MAAGSGIFTRTSRSERPLDRGSIIIIFLLAVAGSLFAGLLQSGDPVGSVPVESVDAVGSVVSLAPCITATLLAIGADDSLAMISDYCPPVENLQRGGTALVPDLERIVRSGSPTLLIRAAVGVPVQELSQVGDPLILPWSSVSQVAASIRSIGEVVKKRQEADLLASRFETVLSGAAPADAPTVLLVIGIDSGGSGGPWIIKTNSLHGAALHAAGYSNAIEDPLSGAPQISLEQLLRIDPDFILHLVPAKEPSQEARQQIVGGYEKLTALKAAQRGTIGSIHHERILDEGPELLDLVDSIAAELNRLSPGDRRW